MSDAIAPWKSPLLRALHRNRSRADARFLQLATVGSDGFPANRTVVFRGFLDGGDRLKMVTDDRSAKIAQIALDPRAEACWYFPVTREQFRLRGHLHCIDGTETDPPSVEARRVAWQELSDNARIQFLWPFPGGDRAEASAFDRPIPDPNLPAEHFCLLWLEPIRVDLLQLRGHPQNRWIYECRAERTWSVREVNP
ncbi:Npun_F5749 family FMN-dependent PPOX-type flavoprotein [Oxynema aestuarii]|uniref:Pyridoxamine 5'-phosphate oxidase n=1 Tax=Oxynema aestuarii AP17 TaxID=2064643 RepID=A0A6H1TXC3_9CYAN|nr:Npun_F5749 family FMN-dependent PPOX-type flavoprotein [Oxynema aestuarii]QIZ71252.1 pyridoxamine 5'-phosphate oxidase [Oxynema aestuarii AP17]RMH75036.1 MAG: pyridoxamine 5'-phosphate oxidase [Cyanobacteria bacterium J007]